MRRWLGRLVRLYPRRWRERYGAEFEALLEDVEPDWAEITNVLGGAMRMQILNGSAWKMVAALGVVGAIGGGVYSFTVPRRYVSTAVLRATPHAGALYSPGEVSNLGDQILSRGSLVEVIQHLKLYPEESRRWHIWETIERMRRDLRIEFVSDSGNASGVAFRISFAYPDRETSQAVVRALVTRFVEMNVATALQARKPGGSGDPMQNLEVLDPASLPARASYPNRASIVAIGLSAGLLLGLLAAFALWRPKWAITIMGWAVGCGVLAGALSFLIPDHYASTATLRLRVPVYDLHGAERAADRVQRLGQKVLSRNGLARIIQDPRLDLYRDARQHQPLEQVIETMRRNIRIAPNGRAPRFPGSSTVDISFTYTDRYKAQSVVRALVIACIEQDVQEWQAASASVGLHWIVLPSGGPGGALDVLDPPDLPELPVFPNHLAMAGMGLAAGIVFGAASLWLRRRSVPPPPPA